MLVLRAQTAPPPSHSIAHRHHPAVRFLHERSHIFAARFSNMSQHVSTCQVATCSAQLASQVPHVATCARLTCCHGESIPNPDILAREAGSPGAARVRRSLLPTPRALVTFRTSRLPTEAAPDAVLIEGASELTAIAHYAADPMSGVLRTARGSDRAPAVSTFQDGEGTGPG